MPAILLENDPLAQACADAPAGGSPDALVKRIQSLFPDLRFRLAMTETDWYRLGGVVGADGTRVAASLPEWAEAESGGDPVELVARFGDSGYLATSLAGKTHYLVAATGSGVMDFIQIEVEEIREIADRELFPADLLPDTLEDVIDPLEPVPVKPRVVTPPRYAFRRAVHMADEIGALTSEYTGDPHFRRFIEEWEHSTAVQATRFCHQWTVTVVPYLGPTGDHVREVKLLSPHGSKVTHLSKKERKPGQKLAKLLHDLQKRTGYHMAWYFLMVAHGFLPFKTMVAIHEDLREGGGRYGFLTERDMKIIAGWIENPYHLLEWSDH